jgi:hypothetical protein
MAIKDNGSHTGKVAFVTGAANGIGRATALAFAREGASVVVADVSEEGNRETAHMIEELGGRTFAVRCDVTKVADVKATLEKTVEAFGRLDFAFNNAGVEPRKPAPTAEYEEEEWNRIRYQPPQRFSVHEARDPADPQAGRRRDRQHVLGRRNHRHQGQPRVHRCEARRHRPHPGSGPRLCRAEDPHQRRLPRIYRHPDDGSLHRDHGRRPCEGDRGGADRGWASPRRSPQSSCGFARIRLPSSSGTP